MSRVPGEAGRSDPGNSRRPYSPANAAGEQAIPSPNAIAESVGKEILRQTEIRPYTVVIVAAAVGYVVAVGTPNWAARVVWNIGSRLAVSRIISALE